MSATDVFDDVAHSFAVLGRECQPQYAAIRERLHRWPVMLSIDSDTLAFTADEHQVVVGGLRMIDDSWVHIATNKECIRQVSAGSLALADAVEDPDVALRVRGPIDGVAAAFDSVIDYVDGSLRCPELETQLERFTSEVIADV